MQEPSRALYREAVAQLWSGSPYTIYNLIYRRELACVRIDKTHSATGPGRGRVRGQPVAPPEPDNARHIVPRSFYSWRAVGITRSDDGGGE